MIRTEFRGPGFKVVISKISENFELGNTRENNFNADIFTELNERCTVLYLRKLYENIARDSATFVAGVKKIYGSASTDVLQNLIHENCPNAGFKIAHVSEEPTIDDLLKLRQRIVQLEYEKGGLNIEHDQQIKNLKELHAVELKLAKEDIEREHNLQVSKLQSYLKNYCSGILQDVIEKEFQFSGESQGNYSDSKVVCRNDNDEVTSCTRLIDSSLGSSSKDLQKLFGVVLNDIRKMYQDKMGRLKEYLTKKKDEERSDMNRHIIDIIDECFQFDKDAQANDSRVECNSDNKAVDGSTRLVESIDEHSASEELQKLFDDLEDVMRETYQSQMGGLKKNLTKHNDKALDDIKRRVTERLIDYNNCNNSNNAGNFVSSVYSQIEETRISELGSSSHSKRNLMKSINKLIVKRDEKIKECGHKLSDRLESPSRYVIKEDPAIMIIDNESEQSMIVRYENESDSPKITNNLVHNEAFNMLDQLALEDTSAGPSSLRNNMVIQREQNFPNGELQEQSVLNIQMTENEVEVLLNQLSKEQADLDSYVPPFPIQDKIFADAYWSNEKSSYDPKKVQQLIKRFKSLRKILRSTNQWLEYKEYVLRNKFYCCEVRCLLRNKRFPTSSHYLAHIKKHHPDCTTIFHCSICSSLFPST